MAIYQRIFHNNKMHTISETEGRRAFGKNAKAYDESRPPYPVWVFDLLKKKGVLHSDTTALEIGSGNGLATRELIDCRVSRLTMLEPDTRFAPLLERLCKEAGAKSKVIYSALEEAEIPNASFDVLLIATTYHWLDPETRVGTLARLTKPGGHVVLIWNVFQDMNLYDPFHEATKGLLAELSVSPSGKPDSLPFALDKEAREKEFLSTGWFETQLYSEDHWKLQLDSKGVRSLYEGFSQIAQLPEVRKQALLDQLEMIADTEFGGSVVRNMTTPLYVFRRCD